MAGTPAPTPRRRGALPIAKLDLRAWRMVEAQHRLATLKLVDSPDEQEVLEALIDRAKPPLPKEREFTGLHYLLATPFRYPPLRHGSRFGARHERGIWYGLERPATTMAEVAFYRVLFLDGTEAEIEHTESEHTLYAVGVRTARGLDFAAGPLAHRRELFDPSSHAAGQRFGARMRAEDVEAFRFPSARDPQPGGVNVGVFSPRAFASRAPERVSMQTWHCVTTRTHVVFERRGLLRARPERLVFEVEGFLVDGVLPRP